MAALTGLSFKKIYDFAGIKKKADCNNEVNVRRVSTLFDLKQSKIRQHEENCGNEESGFVMTFHSFR